MRQIIGLTMAIAMFSSVVFAADVVQREGKDLVVYKQVEVQRYKDVPPEIPKEEVIKIVQKGEGEFPLESKCVAFSRQFGFPFVLTTVSVETSMRYHDGAWSKSQSIKKPVTSDDWIGTLCTTGFFLFCLLVVSLINQKKREGNIKLLLHYAIILVAPLMGALFRLGVTASGHSTPAIVISLYVFAIGGFFLWLWVFRKESLDRKFAMGTLFLAVLIGIMSGAAESYYNADFLKRQLFVTICSCIVSYCIGKLAKWIFRWGTVTSPVVVPNIPTEYD
jgi:hypothetical protein